MPPHPHAWGGGGPAYPEREFPSVTALVERFVDNRRRRQHAIDAHLDEVEDSLTQGDPIKFAFWTLDQDPAFFEAPGPAPKMLQVLGREIGLTAEQLHRLSAHRPAIRKDRETLTHCHELLREARELIQDHIHNSSPIMEDIRRILSPVQVAKFFVWVEKHQHSVKTLTTLWKSVGSDGGGSGDASGAGSSAEGAAADSGAEGESETVGGGEGPHLGSLAAHEDDGDDGSGADDDGDGGPAFGHATGNASSNASGRMAAFGNGDGNASGNGGSSGGGGGSDGVHHHGDFASDGYDNDFVEPLDDPSGLRPTHPHDRYRALSHGRSPSGGPAAAPPPAPPAPAPAPSAPWFPSSASEMTVKLEDSVAAPGREDTSYHGREEPSYHGREDPSYHGREDTSYGIEPASPSSASMLALEGEGGASTPNPSLAAAATRGSSRMSRRPSRDKG